MKPKMFERLVKLAEFLYAKLTNKLSNQETGLHQRLTHLLFREWGWLFVLTFSGVMVLEFMAPITRLNNTMYDVYLNFMQKSPNKNIVIIGVDNKSIQQLGRWPWSRKIHAQMLDKLYDYDPRVVALDFIFSEPESEQADNQLAKAMSRFSHIFLPVISSNEMTESNLIYPVLPLPIFRESVSGIGHIGLRLDRDSIVRSTYFWEGYENEVWPHLMWQVYKSQFPKAHMPPATIEKIVKIAGWQRRNLFYIPFRGPPYTYTIFSYQQLLDGKINKTALKDKFVLVGVTSQSLNDAFSTPTSGNSIPMSGIEIHANILASFLDQIHFRQSPIWLRVVLPFFILAFFFYHLIFSRPAINLSLAITLLLFSMLVGLVLLSGLRIWWSPVATCLGLAAAYPLWSWRRLETVLDYMGQEASILATDQSILPEKNAEDDPIPIDTVGGRIEALNQSIERHRNLRQFMYSSLQSLPDVVIVTDADGYLLVSNELANQFFKALGVRTLTRLHLPSCLADLAAQKQFKIAGNLADKGFNWYNLLPSAYETRHPKTIPDVLEAQSGDGKHWLIKIAASHDQTGVVISWIVSMIDLTDMYAAEQQRDEMLRFLSHDMRAPQTSILALLELRRSHQNSNEEQIFHDIEQQARRALDLADGFALYSKAEHASFHPMELCLNDLLQDAIEFVWALSQQKSIRIDYAPPAELLFVLGDRDLLTRALINLIHNAIKYSPRGRVIECKLNHIRSANWQRTSWISVQIIDQGYGISQAEQKFLFERFYRSKDPQKSQMSGVGLGLPFVKLVIDKHRGHILVSSQLGVGTTFDLRIPSYRTEY